MLIWFNNRRNQLIRTILPKDWEIILNLDKLVAGACAVYRVFQILRVSELNVDYFLRETKFEKLCGIA